MTSRLRTIDLVELRGLCLAIELGSLGRAAAAMGISQPALSKRMRELERFAGTELLLRSPRGVRATAVGEQLYREARALLTHAESVEGVLDGLRGRTAPVRVAASHTIAEYLLPGPLAAFRERAGHAVAVELVAANSAVVRDLVRERRSDLGLAAAIAGGPGPGLVEAPLCADEVSVAVSAGHPWAARAAVSLAEFLATPMVMRDPSSHARRLLEDTLRARGLTAAPPLAEVGSTAAAIAAAVAGRAPAVLSIRAITAAPVLEPVRVEDLRLPRRFVLLTRAGEPPSGPARELIAYLEGAIS
jgi:DNA-binding transcriptional LysR family regulator